MPKCPKCEAEYAVGSGQCEKCGRPLAAGDKPAAKSADGKQNGPGRDPAAVLGDVIRGWWPMILAGILFFAIYWSLLADWWGSWNKPYSYYSHGPLVPLIAIFMVWANRKRMARIKIAPSWWGLALIIPAIPIYVFGRWTGSGVMCGFTFMCFLVGLVLLFTGVRMTRLLLFPILYLLFMIPAPSTVLDSATFKVQMKSTTIATQMLNLTGYSATQNGARIESYDLPEPLVVGTPCSGFRLLISLLTFTAFFVYMVQAPAWKKAVLVILAFPLSLFINALRITMIGYAGIWTGSADAMHKFHDWSGYIGLVICFVILFGIARLLKANRFGIPDPEGEAPPVSRGVVGWNAKGVVSVLLLCLVLASNLLITPLEASAKGQIARENIPKSFGLWISRDLEISEMVAEELKTADILQRVFVNQESGRQVLVMIEAAKDTDAFHDPHSCLPGGGEAITGDRKIVINFTDPKPMKIEASVLESVGDYGPQIVLYWYMTGEESCSSTSDVRKKMRVIQLHDLYRAVFGSGDADVSDADRQWYWYRFSTEVWEDSETDLEALKDFVKEFVANTRDFAE